MAEFPHFPGQEGEVVVALFECVLTASDRCRLTGRVILKTRRCFTCLFLLSY